MAEFPAHMKGLLGELMESSGRIEQTVVNGNSMAPALKSGDWVRIKKTKDIRVGDVILFSRSGGRFLHRVVRMVRKRKGIYYITKGDNSPHIDIPVYSEDVIGKIIMSERGDLKRDWDTPDMKHKNRIIARVSYRRGKLYMKYFAKSEAKRRLKKARNLLNMNEPGSALELLRDAYPLDRENPYLNFYFGVALYRNWEPDKALSTFKEALKFDPTIFLAYTNRAEIFRQQKKFGLALSEVKKVLERSPQGHDVRAYAHNLWGNILSDLEKYDEAITHYDQALKILPDYASCHLNRGWALEQLGIIKEAEEEYRHALALRKNDPKVYRLLGCLLLSTGKFEDAEKIFELARQNNAIDAHILNNLGVTQLKLGKRDEAAASFSEALRKDPSNHAAHDNLVSLGKKVD